MHDDFVCRLPEPLPDSGRGPWRRVAQVAAPVVFFLVLLGEGLHCYRSAHANLDSLDYVSIAESSHQNMVAHAGQECLAQLPAENSGCAELVAHGTLYAQVAAMDEYDYNQYERLYRVKPLFCGLLAAIVRYGHMSGLQALRLVCAVSFVLVGLLAWLWLRVYLGALAASVAALLMMCFSQIVRMGQSLTPDALACVFLLLALYLLLFRKQVWLSVAAFVLLVLTRPENILLVIVLGLAWIAWADLQPQSKLRCALALLAGAAVLYLGTGHFTHPVPWPVFFKLSFVTMVLPPEYATARLGVGQYLRALLTTGANAAAQYLPLELLLGGLALLSARCPLELRRLLYVCAAVTVLRFVLYPTMDERFYTPFLLVAFVAATVSAAQSLPERWAWLKGEEVGRETS